MNNNDKPQEAINRLISDACIPRGLRPESNEDIDAMLDAIGGEKHTDDKLQRMMHKIKGEIHIHPDRNDTSENGHIEATERENELMAMYRDGDNNISPDSQEKLDDMTKRARNENKDAEDGEKDEEQ